MPHPDQAHWDKIHSGRATTEKLAISMELSANYSYGRGAHQREKASLRPGFKEKLANLNPRRFL